MKKTTQVLFAFLVIVLILFPPPAAGQQGGSESRNGALRVYLECAARGCESNHFRTEITYVNWVVDVRDSQLHIIMTSQSTGSGDEFLMDFIGREELEGIDDQLTYAHSDTDPEFERLRGLTSVLSVGLARYSVLAGYGYRPTDEEWVRSPPAPGSGAGSDKSPDISEFHLNLSEEIAV